MKPIACILFAISLFGCNAMNTKKNDARVWVPLSCSGILQWDTCFKEAHALCPKGFDIANKNELRAAQSRTMEVSCKE